MVTKTYLKCLYMLVYIGWPYSSAPIFSSYRQVPPTCCVASRTVKLIPSAFKYLAEVSPPIPAPITHTRLAAFPAYKNAKNEEMRKLQYYKAGQMHPRAFVC